MANRKLGQKWDHLRYFLAVARTGTLLAAVEQLGTEHTTVARYVRALEDVPNARLFHWSDSGYELADAGERVATGTEAIESAYAARATDVRVGSSTERGAANTKVRFPLSQSIWRG